MNKYKIKIHRHTTSYSTEFESLAFVMPDTKNTYVTQNTDNFFCYFKNNNLSEVCACINENVSMIYVKAQIIDSAFSQDYKNMYDHYKNYNVKELCIYQIVNHDTK